MFCLEPDLVSAPGSRSKKKIAERALKGIRRKLKIMIKDRPKKKEGNNFFLTRWKIFKTNVSGSGSGLEKIMHQDPVCPERLNPDPVNFTDRIRNPDRKSVTTFRR